jgi:hypothetical protein
MNWFWRSIHWFKEKDREANLADYLVVLLTTVIAFWAGMTWWEMHDAGTQTNRIIAADERLATAMENSVKEAGKSLDATIDNFHLDQRAWIGPNEMLPPPFMDGTRRVYMKEGEQVQWGVIITNTGKTPAKNVTQRTSYRSLPATAEFTVRYPGAAQHVGVIEPNAKVWAMPPTTERLMKTQVESYTTGVNKLYFYGTISYEDIFSKEHHTTFCFYLVKDLSGFTNCEIYNEAD